MLASFNWIFGATPASRLMGSHCPGLSPISLTVGGGGVTPETSQKRYKKLNSRDHQQISARQL